MRGEAFQQEKQLKHLFGKNEPLIKNCLLDDKCKVKNILKMTPGRHSKWKENSDRLSWVMKHTIKTDREKKRTNKWEVLKKN